MISIKDKRSLHNSDLSDHLREIYLEVRWGDSPEIVNEQLHEALHSQLPGLIGCTVLAEASRKLYPRRFRQRESSIYKGLDAWSDLALTADDIAEATSWPRRGGGNYIDMGVPKLEYTGVVESAAIVGEELRMRLEKPNGGMIDFTGEYNPAVVRIIAPNPDTSLGGIVVHTQLYRQLPSMSSR